MLNVEDWAEIRRLHRAEGVPIKVIARRLRISKNTVRKALAAAQPPSYRRAAKGSIVDAVEPQIRALLAATQSMPSTVIAERIGWDRSLTVRSRQRGGLMTGNATTSRNVASEIAFLTRALKAASLAASVERLAERARAESWTHEEFLAACLQREVAARESHGGEGRIRAAGSRPARAWRSSTTSTNDR